MAKTTQSASAIRDLYREALSHALSMMTIEEEVRTLSGDPLPALRDAIIEAALKVAQSEMGGEVSDAVIDQLIAGAVGDDAAKIERAAQELAKDEIENFGLSELAAGRDEFAIAGDMRDAIREDESYMSGKTGEDCESDDDEIEAIADRAAEIIAEKYLAQSITVGDRIRLESQVERYPHFIAEIGAVGTIIEISPDMIRAKMDAPISGAEDWDNVIEWFNLADLQSDVVKIAK